MSGRSFRTRCRSAEQSEEAGRALHLRRTGINPGPKAATYASEPQQRGTCAYAYQGRSDTDRTNGRRTWPVTATTSWTVTSTSNIGIAGVLTLTGTATQQVSVIEWRSELRSDPPADNCAGKALDQDRQCQSLVSSAAYRAR
jgi:hypothetical protein